jgi:hemerythrin-like domain-containing protein
VKRHPQLQPLSDEHHAALVLARRMRREGEAAAGGPALAAAWREAQARFAGELEPHFRVEESVLFPLLDAAGETALVEQARADHARLRELIGGPPDPSAALAFGELLHRHVRSEERALFPRAEAVLRPEDLEAVGRAARQESPSSRPPRR